MRGLFRFEHRPVQSSDMALRPRPDLEAAIRSRVTRIAVGPSTVRGTPSGTAKAARRFLRTLPLRSFSARTREEFIRTLDRFTVKLQAALPVHGQRWGVARKVLNIYLRDRVYSAHLRSTYGLGRVESFCEVPLDSITARKLCESGEGSELPAWPGVGGLTPEVSARYHAVANQIARARKLHAVHLDVFWWSEDRDD
jgi:hypothetical protein